MVENIVFGFFVTALFVGLGFITYKVNRHSGMIEKTIEEMKSVTLAKGLLLLMGAAFTLMVIVFISYLKMFGIHPTDSHEKWGQFGDFLGGTLNPILSFLSLIALLTTIALQSTELELTRKELKRSASAQEETKKVLDQQSETLARQQFESTFFSLLDQHNKILESLNRKIVIDKTDAPLIYHIRGNVFKNSALRGCRQNQLKYQLTKTIT